MTIVVCVKHVPDRQRRLGHASPGSMRIYTRVSDEQVLADYDAALGGRS